MRVRFSLLLVLLLVPRVAWAAPTLSWALTVMFNTNNSSSCAVAVPATKSAAVGDELVVFIALGNPSQTVTAPTSTGVVWSSAHCANAGGNEAGCVFGGQVTSTQAAATSYTFTDSTAARISICDMFDVAGTNNVIDYSNTTQGTGGGTTFTMTPTLSVANDFVAALMFNYNVTQYTSVTFGAGWTGTPTNVNNSFSAGNSAGADFYNVQTASGSPGLVVNYTPTTWSDYVIVALQPAASTALKGFSYVP